MLNIDTWLNEHEEACIDDFLVALIIDEKKWKSENEGIFIDDHLLTYISALENVYHRKHGKSIDYFGLLSGHVLTQEDVYAILINIVASGESFFSGYLNFKKDNSIAYHATKSQAQLEEDTTMQIV